MTLRAHVTPALPTTTAPRCDCEEYDRILADADPSSRKPGGITVDDLARIAEAIKAVSETDDDVPAIAFALSRCIISHFEQV